MEQSQKMQDLPLLWKVSQVAKYFGVHRITVYRWITDGKVIRPDEVMHLTNRVRIKRGAVERIVREKQQHLRQLGDSLTQ